MKTVRQIIFNILHPITRILPYTIKMLWLQKYIRIIMTFSQKSYQKDLSFDGDMKIEVDPSKELGRAIACLGYHHYETALFLKNYLKKNYIVLDVGANFGDHSLLMSKYGGTVHSFEPHDTTFQWLVRNVQKNNKANIVINQIALGKEDGVFSLYEPPTSDNEGLFSLTPLDGFHESAKVKVTTLDQYVLEKNIEKIDFVKCDVEGAELAFLMGGRNSLLKWSPTLLLEINEATYCRTGYNTKELMNFLKELGYKHFFVPWLGGGLMPIEETTILDRSQEDSFDIVAFN